VRNGTEAVELGQRARQLTDGRDPLALRALAAAFAECGRFAEATAMAQRALQLAVDSPSAAWADALRTELKLYQAGSPCRDDGKSE